MLRSLPFVIFAIVAFSALGCAEDTVVQTGEINVEVNESVDFTQFQTFSVVTQDLVDPPEDVPELGDEQEAFNDLVNDLIIEAMQAEPVCLEYIPPEQVSAENQPDVWAANGLGRSTEGGYVYQCCGGWWWGYWGWYWDPCAYWCPNYVQFDVGSLFVPVALPPVADEDPVVAFAGLAQSILDTGPVAETKVRAAIEAIFQYWPEQTRPCPASQ